jgi:hypothetical protein
MFLQLVTVLTLLPGLAGESSPFEHQAEAKTKVKRTVASTTLSFEERFVVRKTYISRKKDTLAQIAEKLYSSGKQWKKLIVDNTVVSEYGPNETLGKRKRLIYFAPKIGTSYHIQPRDTLTRISRWKYGTTSCWQNIYNDNKSHVANFNLVQVGRILKLRGSCDGKLNPTQLSAKRVAKHPAKIFARNHSKKNSKRSLSSVASTEPPSLAKVETATPANIRESSTRENALAETAPVTQPTPVTSPIQTVTFEGAREVRPLDTLHSADSGVRRENNFSLGVAFLNYQQTGSLLNSATFTQLGPMAAISGEYSFGSSDWSLMYQGSIVLPYIYSNPSDSYLITVDGDARVSWQTSLSDSASGTWYLQPGLGFSYLTSFGSANYGYSNLYGPELYLGVGHRIGDRRNFGVNLKYTQSLNADVIGNVLACNSFTLAVDYKFSKLGVFLFSTLTGYAVSPDNSLSAATGGLGVNYAF